jgi:Zn-dependent protease with chaperone function
MSNGKVITAYLLFTIITALIPGLLFNHWLGYTLGAALVIIWWGLATVIGDNLLLRTIKAEPLNVVRYGEIGKIVTTYRMGPNMGVPSLWMVNNLSPMIMSIGLNPKSSHVILTRGLLDKLDDKVQRAMMVRELESIRAGRTACNTGAATLLWFILIPGRIGGLITGKEPGDPNVVTTILDIIPAFVAAFFVAMTADRASVFSLDRAAQKNLDNPDYLPYALIKFQESALALSFNLDLALSPCCAINPTSRDPFVGLFKNKPPTPKRIDRLRPKTKTRQI